MIMGVDESTNELAGLFDSGDPYDRFIWWPNDVEAFARQVQSEIWAVATDYSRAIAIGAISQSQLQAFKSFYTEWQTYYTGLNWIDWLNGGGTVKSLKAYRERANNWRNDLRTAGVALTSPEMPGASGPRGDQANILDTLTKLVVAGGVVYLGVRIINDTGILKRLGRKA